MIYKLKYPTREAGIADLKSKGVLTVKGWASHVEALVEVGQIPDGPLLKGVEPTFLPGYHFDLLSSEVINFSSEVKANHPKHQFA